MTETINARDTQARSRSELYYFLSSLFLKPPSSYTKAAMRELVCSAKKSMEFVNGTEDLLTLVGGVDDADMPNLIQEYHDLFKVPLEKYVAPYESVYREKRRGGYTSAAVEKTYARFGFSIPHEYHDLADHIGLELAFMATLCREEARAFKNNRFLLVKQLQDTQNNFLQEHLVCWVPDLCKNIFEKTQSNFYRAVANITHNFVYYDISIFCCPLHST